MTSILVMMVQAAVVPAGPAPLARPVDVGRVDLGMVGSCRGTDDEALIVVCARPDARHRLPLPVERPAVERVVGEGATGTAALTPYARCGIFAGERTCTKREAARYGYGEGRDPVSVLGRLIGRAIDPDGP